MDFPDVNDNWKGEKQYAKGSVFGGSFIIPFDKVEGKSSFVLQLVGKSTDGETEKVLRAWDVTLPTASKQVSANYDLFTWDGTSSAFTENKTAKDDAKTYNVLRNFLYGIGKRTLDDPKEPGKDPDEPTPINNKQELELQVNDNWEVIYEMGVD